MEILRYGELTCNVLPESRALSRRVLSNQSVYNFLNRSVPDTHIDDFIAIVTRRYTRIPWNEISISTLYSDNARLRESRLQTYQLNIFNHSRASTYFRIVSSYLVWLYDHIQGEVMIDFEATLSTLTEIADILGVLRTRSLDAASDVEANFINNDTIDILVMILLTLEAKHNSVVFMDKMVEFLLSIFHYFDLMPVSTQLKISEYCNEYDGYFSQSPLYYARSYLLSSESLEVKRNIKMAMVLG